MSAVALKSYNYSMPPGDSASLPFYLQRELRKLQEVVESYRLALVQLQAKVNP